MKGYTVLYAPSAVCALRKMDRQVCAIVYAWIDKNLSGCENPRARGKALAGNLSGLWRYRVGDWRILAEIRDEALTILVLEIGHRSVVYRD